VWLLFRVSDQIWASRPHRSESKRMIASLELEARLSVPIRPVIVIGAQAGQPMRLLTALGCAPRGWVEEQAPEARLWVIRWRWWRWSPPPAGDARRDDHTPRPWPRGP